MDGAQNVLPWFEKGRLEIRLGKCRWVFGPALCVLRADMRAWGWVERVVILLVLAGGGVAFAAKPNVPVVTVDLEPLGFNGVPARFVGTSATFYTVHYVDGTHVLLTWNAKSLMPRLPDATPDDDDRTVAAVLLEVPSGKVLARTQWRTRDQNEYLYGLGHGRFLLRVRTRFTLIEPMRRLAAGEDAFKEQPFLDTKRRIGYVSISAGGDLLTVETVPRSKRQDADVLSDVSALDGEDDDVNRRVPVQIHFYRMHEGEGGLAAISSGVIYSPSLVNVPATAEGYLDLIKESSSAWDFDFKTHTGKKTELAAFDTSCAPKPYWVSRSEFVAFGCRGDAHAPELSGFNLKGENAWLQTFSETLVSPTIVAAPEVGRFALERVMTSQGAFLDPENLSADVVTGQEIQVLQNHDGRTLLKVQASPVQRAGQNFDFAPDGSQLAVMQGLKLAIYQLPALTLKDRSEVAKATENVPEKNMAVIELDSVPVTGRAQAKAEGVKVGTEVMQTSAGEVVAPPAAESRTSPEDGNVVGDVPAERRKAPSLFDKDHPKPQ